LGEPSQLSSSELESEEDSFKGYHTPNNHLGIPVYPEHDNDIAKIHLGNPVYPKHDNHTAKIPKHYPTSYSQLRSPVNPKHDYHFAQIHLGNPVCLKCTDIHSTEVT